MQIIVFSANIDIEKLLHWHLCSLHWYSHQLLCINICLNVIYRYTPFASNLCIKTCWNPGSCLPEVLLLCAWPAPVVLPRGACFVDLCLMKVTTHRADSAISSARACNHYKLFPFFLTVHYWTNILWGGVGGEACASATSFSLFLFPLQCCTFEAIDLVAWK